MGAKRRRTKAEKTADDLVVANKESEMQAKLAKISELENELKDA
jgi:hypothetical protein